MKSSISGSVETRLQRCRGGLIEGHQRVEIQELELALAESALQADGAPC